MNTIKSQLNKIKQSKKIGLMTHVVVGYPTIEFTVPLIETLAEAGSDFIELQIPFSDPIADGPTIMKASDQALKNGVTTETAFQTMLEASAKVEIPLLFMCYYNTVFKYGVEKFCKRAQEVGAKGLIIPDVPPEEEVQEKLIEFSTKYEVPIIRVISPASSEERLQLNASVADGFVYCVSRFGVTGASSQLDVRLAEYLKRAKKHFSIPVAVGFGISKKEHIDALKKIADIAVVGSAIINVVDSTNQPVKEKLENVKQFVEELKM